MFEINSKIIFDLKGGYFWFHSNLFAYISYDFESIQFIKIDLESTEIRV